MSGLENVQLHFVDDYDSVWEFYQWLDGREEIAVDTETTGLKIGRDRVRLAQVGGQDDGWAIEWRRWSGIVEEISKKFEGRVIMHNAKFDAGMMGNDEVQFPRHRIDDTMVMAHILEPNYSAGLKQQASRHVDALAAGAQAQLDVAINGRGGWTWETVPVSYGPYWQYAALDTVLTYRLKQVHWPEVKARYLKSYELEMATTWVAEKMERHGALIDHAYAVEKQAVFLKYINEAEQWVRDQYGVAPGSNQAIIKILMEAGYRFDKLTESGALALDKEVLTGIDHPLARTVLQRRQLQKLESAYLRHFINDTDAAGFIHPDIRTLGARTGRMSISDPSLQNLPTKSETNKAAEVVRNCVVSQDGHTLLMPDLDQIEMRLLAHYSNDVNLRNAFLQPGDFFCNIGAQIYGDPNFQKSDPRRRRVKNVSYAKIYGAGLEKMAQTAGVPVAEIRAVRDGFDANFPGVPAWQKQVDRVAWQRQKDEGEPYALSYLTGRKQVAEANKVYALVNRLIQGTAAEAFKMKLLELDAAGLGDYFVVPVHDEIVMDVPDAEVPDAIETIRKIMNDDQMFSVPISAGVAAGKRWGLKEDLG